MKRRSGNLLSSINSMIGSATHWLLRGLIAWLADKFGITIPTWLERNLAYYGAGLLLVVLGVWHYLPWLPGLNFSPPTISIDWTTILTAASLVIVIIQTFIIYRQLHIMEKQDELLARRSDLCLVGKYNHGLYQFEFDVQNMGTKGTSGFYWDIFVPASISDGRHMRITNAPQFPPKDRHIFQGIAYNRYTGFRDDPLYPSRSKYISNFPLPSIDTKGVFRFYWQLVGEDGIFPAKDHYGTFELAVD